jgi:hypothetical protein
LTETKIQDDIRDLSIDVYPNPATNYFVVYNYKLNNNQVLLYDITGKLIRNIRTSSLTTKVDVSSLANGIYVLAIKDPDGRNIRTEKIVVNR